MAGSAEALKQKPISIEHRVLTEVRHLANHRLPNGEYPDYVLADVLTNKKTAIQEGAIPHAISVTSYEVHNEDRRRVTYWMGKTAVENARSGYEFYFHDAAYKRTDVDVDEGHYLEENLQKGVMKYMLSPRMSEKDAPKEVAEQENLATDDAIRASWFLEDENGNIAELVTQSILVKHIPLEAWVKMLADPNNVFGKAIIVDDPESALSVMQQHRELEIPLGMVPDGPVGLVRAVLDYIDDPKTRKLVADQVNKFESDQGVLDQQAERAAERWLKFEVELETSLHEGYATPELKRFIVNFQHEWNEEALDLLADCSEGGEYRMSDDLAIMLENARINTLWTAVAVVAGNEEVISQLKPEDYRIIYENEQRMQRLAPDDYQMRIIEAENNRLIAQNNVRVGGGCPGRNEGKFGAPGQPGFKDGSEGGDWRSDPDSWKKGYCRITVCPNSKQLTEVGPCDVCKDCQHVYDLGGDPSDQNVLEQIADLFSGLDELLTAAANKSSS